MYFSDNQQREQRETWLRRYFKGLNQPELVKENGVVWSEERYGEQYIEKAFSDFFKSVFYEKRIPNEMGMWVIGVLCLLISSTLIWLITDFKIISILIIGLILYIFFRSFDREVIFKQYVLPHNIIQDLYELGINNLVKEGMEKLNIDNPESLSQVNHILYKAEGLSSIDEALRGSKILTKNSKATINSITNRININKNDFLLGTGFRGRKKKKYFSVYEFIVLFLFEDHICYYWCYWNLLKDRSVNGSSFRCSVVSSVEARENSTSNAINKRIYNQSYIITTINGERIEFINLSEYTLFKETFLSQANKKLKPSKTKIAADFIQRVGQLTNNRVQNIQNIFGNGQAYQSINSQSQTFQGGSNNVTINKGNYDID